MTQRGVSSRQATPQLPRAQAELQQPLSACANSPGCGLGTAATLPKPSPSWSCSQFSPGFGGLALEPDKPTRARRRRSDPKAGVRGHSFPATLPLHTFTCTCSCTTKKKSSGNCTAVRQELHIDSDIYIFFFFPTYFSAHTPACRAVPWHTSTELKRLLPNLWRFSKNDVC